MPDKKKSLDKLTLIALSLILLAVLLFVYNFIMGVKTPVTSYNYSLGQFKVVNTETMAVIKELDVCGNWPFASVSLSAGRGNPFSRKNIALPQMTATSTIQCLPLTQ